MKILKTIILSCIVLSATSIMAQKAKNIIVLIGDGTGLTQLYSTYEANNRFLNIYTMPQTALSITFCSDRRVTDSGAGGTAIACGQKTHYEAIGVDSKDKPIASMLEIFKQMGKKTAIIVSCDVCHATPASFIAHVKNRNMYEDIAKYYLTENCDIFLGGGKQRFTNRKDSLNLIDSLKARDYEVVYTQENLLKAQGTKIAGLFADKHLPLYAKRGNIMQTALKNTLERFKDNEEGFFIMLEGSQIDMEAHDNNFNEMIGEAQDFDKCVGIALDYAKRDGNTLVVVTADHETGGLTLPVKQPNSDTCAWSTTGHTAAPIIIYAYGPGSENFHGVIQNNETFDIIMEAAKRE